MSQQPWKDTAWPVASNAPRRPTHAFKDEDIICLSLAEVRARCPRLAPPPTPRPQAGCVTNFAPLLIPYQGGYPSQMGLNPRPR